jgi:hypothetical protein
MDDFEYEEEISFVDLGVPALVYQQRAWSPSDQEMLHMETGLWRSDQEGDLAVTIALPRVTEVSEGWIKHGHIELAATSVSRAKNGAGLVATQRRYDCVGDSITYEIAMITEGVAVLAQHLRGELRRVD